MRVSALLISVCLAPLACGDPDSLSGFPNMVAELDPDAGPAQAVSGPAEPVRGPVAPPRSADPDGAVAAAPVSGDALPLPDPDSAPDLEPLDPERADTEPAEPADAALPDADLAPDAGDSCPDCWPRSRAPADYQGTGGAPGDLAIDLVGVDQRGEQVSLRQFYGAIVVVEFTTMWCGPCEASAEAVHRVVEQGDALSEDFDVWYVQVLTDDEVPGLGNAGGWAEADDAALWADRHGIDTPVIAGRGAVTGARDWAIGAVPTVVVLDPTFEIQRLSLGVPPAPELVDEIEQVWRAFRIARPDWVNPMAP